MFESIPTYPNPYRYWDLVQRHKVTQFYTAPTAGMSTGKIAPRARYSKSSDCQMLRNAIHRSA